MNKFKRVLSDAEIEDIVISLARTSEDSLGFGKEVVEHIQYAVLAKLAEQEPVAYLYDDEVYGNVSGAISDFIKQHGQPLYANPAAPKYTGESK